MCNDRSYFDAFKSNNEVFQVVNNQFIDSHGLGTVKMESVVKGTRRNLTIKDFLLATDMIMDLVSV